MRNNTIWYTNCARCNARILNEGSGRPKRYCNANCARQYRLNTMRVYSNKRARAAGIMPQACKRQTNRMILNAEKLRRGECELHPSYNNGERKFVTLGYEYLFDMDHIDRKQKNKTIAKMIGDPVARLLAEIAKCQMVCAECHRRKTVENKDWQNITKHLTTAKKEMYTQETLFDN